MTRLLCSALIIYLLIPFHANAVDVDNLAFFARCYNSLTGRPLPLNHPLRAGLKNNSINGLTKCKELLAKGKIDTGTNRTPVGDGEGPLVLRQLFDVHRSWFSGVDFRHMNFYEDNVHGNYDLYDGAEAALGLTYILLSNNNKKYERILKESHGYFPLRTFDAVEDQRFAKSKFFLKTAGDPVFYTHNLPSRVDEGRVVNVLSMMNSEPQITVHAAGATTYTFPADPASLATTLTFTPVTVGELSGIQPDSRSTILPNYTPAILFKAGGSAKAYVDAHKNESAENTAGMIRGFNLFGSNGGGVIGLPSFMIINWGLSHGNPATGAIPMPRRWAQRTLETFLCKELPVLRPSDVSGYMDKTGSPTAAPFRKSSTCLQCHATMDQFASTARNYVLGYSDWPVIANRKVSGKNVKLANVMGKFTASNADGGWQSTPQADFHKQIPGGKIYFRSFSGELINQPVVGIQQAADALTQTNDFYQCAAKRYFQHFTGINVKLYDRGDSRYAQVGASIGPREARMRQFIEKLGSDLRADPNQSTYRIIEKIIESSYYRDLNFDPEVP